MWDTSESNSESSSSGLDDFEKSDPTFRCRVTIDPPKIIRKSGRFLKSVSELGSLFSVESKDKKSKKTSKAVHSRVVEKSSIKMPLCKNDYKGVCGEDGGCYCYCENNKEGACEMTCVCLMVGMDEIPSSVPSILKGDMGLSSKMGMSNASQMGSRTGTTGSKTGYSGIKIVECIGNYDMFYDDENMADSDVSVVHHTDIYTDAIYIHPYNSGGYQTSTGIYVETIIDHLPPEIIIEIEWGVYGR